MYPDLVSSIEIFMVDYVCTVRGPDWFQSQHMLAPLPYNKIMFPAYTCSFTWVVSRSFIGKFAVRKVAPKCTFFSRYGGTYEWNIDRNTLLGPRHAVRCPLWPASLQTETSEVFSGTHGNRLRFLATNEDFQMFKWHLNCRHSFLAHGSVAWFWNGAESVNGFPYAETEQLCWLNIATRVVCLLVHGK